MGTKMPILRSLTKRPKGEKYFYSSERTPKKSARLNFAPRVVTADLPCMMRGSIRTCVVRGVILSFASTYEHKRQLNANRAGSTSIGGR